jgi:hypothetical protein
MIVFQSRALKRIERSLQKAERAKKKFEGMSVAKRAAVILRWGSFDAWYDQLESTRKVKLDIQKLSKLIAAAENLEK